MVSVALFTWAMAAARADGQVTPPAGCDTVSAFYEAHEVARDFYPCGFYGVAGVHPMLAMPPATAAEMGLERSASYGVNVVISNLDMVSRPGRPPGLGQLGQLICEELLPRYEIKVLPTLANQGFRFSADAFAGMQRDKPLLNDGEMATVEAKLADKLTLAADVASRYPDAILGFITDDEPHLMAPSVAAARLVEKHTGRLATFPMPTYDHVAAYSEHIQPMIADWYVCGDSSRDSWCIGSRMRTIARHWPGRIVWFAPLAISFTGGHEPTLPNLQDSRTTSTELRLQCWSALALGAKGILFYNPGGWAFTWGGNEDPLFDVMGRPNAPHPRQDNLAEIRSLAADFTTIGPSLVTACPIFDSGIGIACSTVRYATFAGPAIDCGLLHDAATGRDFVVPWNNDVDHEQRGTLTLPAAVLTGGRRVYDLHELEAVETAADGRLEVTLPPGGGRIYLIGDAAAFTAVRDNILRHRVRPERVRARALAHRLRAMAGPRAPTDAFATADAAIARARAAEATEDWETAAEAYRDAANDLERRKADLPSAATAAVLDRAGGIIAAADDLMRTHDARLYGIGPMTDSQRLSDPKLPVQNEQRAWIALVKRYLDLEYKLFVGSSAADRSAAESLVRDATSYRSSLWKTFSRRLDERRKPIRVAIVTADREGIEETMAYAWAYGRCEACWIAPDERGMLADTDGRPFDPAEYDVVWVHQLRYHSPPVDGKPVDPERAIMPALTSPDMVESLRGYVSAGGGMLLTGIAGLYAIPLGIETVLPDRLRENGYLSRDLSVGIVPVPGAEGHPVFGHVPAAGHLTHGGFRGQTVVTECAWEKSRPSGTVLAEELDGQFGRLSGLATIVEYAIGAGKVIVLGGLGCDLTPGGGEAAGRDRTRQTTLDSLEYLAGPRRYKPRQSAESTVTAAAVLPLGQRNAPAETGPTWMQNSRARVELVVGNGTPIPAFRYLRWNEHTDTWTPFLDKAFISSDIGDAAERKKVQQQYGVSAVFDGVSASRVSAMAKNDSAWMRFRLERAGIWAEYRLTLLEDSPVLLVEQSGQSRPDLAASAVVILDKPMEFGVAGTSENPADVTPHFARDQRDQAWLLRINSFFATAIPGESRAYGIIPAAAVPPGRVILMTPGIKQLSQVPLPFFYVGEVGPAAADPAALQRWVGDQLPRLDPFRPRRPDR